MAKKKETVIDGVGVEVVPVDEKGDIPVLDLVPYFDEKDNKVVLKGNYETVETYLKSRKDAILANKFSAKDLDTVLKYKKEAVAYRNALKTMETNGKRKYFNDPKDVYAGKVATLQAIVSEIEAATDKVLEKEEKKRIADINVVLDLYKEKFQQTFKLSDECLAEILYRSGYYNKGAKEKETKDDLEAQFKVILDRENAKKAGIAIVTKLCAVDPRINLQHFLNRIGNADIALIMGEIDEEVERLKEVDRKKAEAVVPQTGSGDVRYVVDGTGQGVTPPSSPSAETVVLGVTGKASEWAKSDFPGLEKVKTIEITYPVDLADAVGQVFTKLREFGVKIREVETQV